MPNIPDAVLWNLRCSRCRNWISCGPIRLLPGGKTLCGRCQVPKDGPKGEYRHFAFEALACYFKFPCKNYNNRCPEVLNFKKILEHEKKCSYSSTCGMFFQHPIALCQPKKYLDKRAVIQFEVIPDEVLQYLRCGSCAGYLSSGPVHVCRDGTSICHRCSKQLVPNSEFIKDEDFQKLVYMMIFPCIYRYQGCTAFFKFGEQSENHENECMYSRPAPSSNRSSMRQYQSENPPNLKPKRQESMLRNVQTDQVMRRQESMLRNAQNGRAAIISEPVVKRQELVLKPGQKERGVIATHRGHIYATLTPNAPLFTQKSQYSKYNGHDEFQLLRENLAQKWGRGYQGQSIMSKTFQDVRSSANHTPPQEPNNFNDNASPEGSISDRIDSMFGDIGVDNNPYPSVITELKIKQKHNYKVPNNQGSFEASRNEYYNKEKAPQLSDYSVHN